MSHTVVSETHSRLKLKFTTSDLASLSQGEAHNVAYHAESGTVQTRVHGLTFDGGERADDTALAVGGTLSLIHISEPTRPY